MQKVVLCELCADQMREGYSVRAEGESGKVFCSRCKRRKYGGTYELTPKKKEAGK